MKFEMKTKALRFLSDIQTGPFGSQLHKEDYVDDGTPIVTVEHLGNRVFTEQNLPRVSNEDKQRLSKYILKEGDIVFSRVGSVDRCSFVDSQHTGWLFSGRCLRVRPFEEISPLFLYYFFCLESTKKFMRNIAVGATMPSINTKLMGEIEVSYPDKQVQEKIANLLGAIDDKIELNNAINDNLADIIQSVYQNRFSSTRSDVTAGVLADICSYSKDKVPVLDLNNSNYYSTENMQSDKKVPLMQRLCLLLRRPRSAEKAMYSSLIFAHILRKSYTANLTADALPMFFASAPRSQRYQRFCSALYMLTISSTLWLLALREQRCLVAINSRL